MRFSPKPCAIAASDFALHGAMIIPSVRKDPLEMDAPMSPGAYTTVAKRLDLFAGVRRFVQQSPRAPATDHQVRFDASLAQPLEKANAVDGAGRAGDADDEAHGSLRYPVPEGRVCPSNPQPSPGGIAGTSWLCERLS